MPSRRAFLVSLTTTGLVGCVGNTPSTRTESSADTATTMPGTPARPAMTIEAAAVQYAYRHIENVDWNAIRTADGQFVFVTVDAREADPAPDRDAFTLVTADETHDPVDIQERYPVGLDVPGEPYPSEQRGGESRGWLVFETPAQLDTAPSLRMERGTDSWEWRLDTEKATTPPPAWEETASIPDTGAPEATFDIPVSAENVGDGPGTFRGAVNFSYPLYRPKGFDIVLDPMESGEGTVSATSKNADPGRELNYGVRTPAGESEVSVTVEADSSVTQNTS